jgi:hypothetical protein
MTVAMKTTAEIWKVRGPNESPKRISPIDSIKHKKGKEMLAYRSVNIGIDHGWFKLSSHCPKNGSANNQVIKVNEGRLSAGCFWMKARTDSHNKRAMPKMVAMGVFRYFHKVW